MSSADELVSASMRSRSDRRTIHFRTPAREALQLALAHPLPDRCGIDAELLRDLRQREPVDLLRRALPRSKISSFAQHFRPRQQLEYLRRRLS